MPSNEKKEPLEKLTDKLRSLFGSGDHLKTNYVLPPKARFSIWYFLLAILFFSYLQTFFFSAKVETIPYSQFKQYIAESKVVKLTIGPEKIKGRLTGSSGQEFRTVRVNDPGLVRELDENKVSYSGKYENKFLSGLLSWILPLGVFF